MMKYLVALLFYFLSVESLRFNMPLSSRKCIKDEVFRDTLVTGEYEITNIAAGSMQIEIKDSEGHILFQKRDATKGKFSFTTENFDIFNMCFISDAPNVARGAAAEVFLNIKHGVEGKNYDTLAKMEKLKPLEVELKRLEDIADSIVKDFVAMHTRTESMRSTNESTHSRVLYFSIFSMCCLLVLAIWQILYLRKYFKSKKLIE